MTLSFLAYFIVLHCCESVLQFVLSGVWKRPGFLPKQFRYPIVTLGLLLMSGNRLAWTLLPVLEIQKWTSLLKLLYNLFIQSISGWYWMYGNFRIGVGLGFWTAVLVCAVYSILRLYKKRPAGRTKSFNNPAENAATLPVNCGIGGCSFINSNTNMFAAGNSSFILPAIFMARVSSKSTGWDINKPYNFIKAWYN